MIFHKRIRLATGIFALVAAFLTTGCTPPAVHPNQLNDFDGAMYDSLTLAHGALTSLRVSLSQNYPSHNSDFNKAAGAYNQAIAGYALYRSSQQESSVDASIRDLTLAIVLLETSLQSDLHVDGKKTAHVRASAEQIRAHAARAHVNVSDIMTELEIAAAVAQTVPSAQSYSTLAKAVIDATSCAVNSEQASAGRPIDLQTIPAISSID